MNGRIDSLAWEKAKPRLVERAIRAAIADALAWRAGGGRPPSADAFAAAALADVRRLLDARDADARTRADALARVGTAARRFAVSALGKRLLSVPSQQLVRVTSTREGADALVRGRDRRLHAVAVRGDADALAAARVATEVAAVVPASARDGLTPLTVHVYSLVDGRRFRFERERRGRAARVA